MSQLQWVILYLDIYLENIADLMTKVLYEHKTRYLVSNIFYDIYDDHKLSSLVESRMHAGRFDHICHGIKHGGIRLMHSIRNPDSQKGG